MENEEIIPTVTEMREDQKIANPEQIEAWKAEHGEIFRINIDGHIAYLKKPNRKVIGYASTIGTKDPIKFNEIILNGCWIDGDPLIKTNDELFMAASTKISDLIVVKTAELEKL